MVQPSEQSVLEEVAQALADAKAQLPVAQRLVATLREAGEAPEEVETIVAELEGRIQQWERTLMRRGITIPESPSSEEEGE